MKGRAGKSGPETGEATMKNPYAIALVSALITAGAIKAAPALAETPSANLETRVSYVQTADLDLSNQAASARSTSGSRRPLAKFAEKPSDSDLVGQNKARECRQDVISRATAIATLCSPLPSRGAIIAITASR